MNEVIHGDLADLRKLKLNITGSPVVECAYPEMKGLTCSHNFRIKRAFPGHLVGFPESEDQIRLFCLQSQIRAQCTCYCGGLRTTCGPIVHRAPIIMTLSSAKFKSSPEFLMQEFNRIRLHLSAPADFMIGKRSTSSPAGPVAHYAKPAI